MAVTRDRPAPYAPASAILSIIERHRSRGLPSPVDGDVLERAGVSVSLIPRTLQALQVLDLIGEDGQLTDTLEAIRLAPEAEYKSRLAEWLTEAYADALAYIDPATATETDVRDAFRKYIPTGQQDRMVSLFMGLFTAAGVMPERQRQVAPRKANGGGGMRMVKVINPPPRQRAQPKQSLIGGAGVTPTELPPALAGMVASLAAEGPDWSAERRDQFVAALRGLIDFCFPVGAAKAAPTETATDQE